MPDHEERIYADKRKSMRHLLRRLMLTGGSITFVFCVASLWLGRQAALGVGWAINLGKFTRMMAVLVSLECILITLMMAVILWRQKSPVLTFSPAGLTVKTFGQRFGCIPWDEIREFRLTRGVMAALQVVPADVWRLARRLGPRQGLSLLLNAGLPISVLTMYLPGDLEDTLAKLRAYHAHYSQQMERGDHIWPPPPEPAMSAQAD